MNSAMVQISYMSLAYCSLQRRIKALPVFYTYTCSTAKVLTVGPTKIHIVLLQLLGVYNSTPYVGGIGENGCHIECVQK